MSNCHLFQSILIGLLMIFCACQNNEQETENSSLEKSQQNIAPKQISNIQESVKVPEKKRRERKALEPEIQALLDGDLKTNDQEHFKQIEDFFKIMTDKATSRSEKRLVQNKLESYFANPTEKTIVFYKKEGEEHLSFYDFIRKLRLISMNVLLENVSLTESNQIQQIVIREL